MTDQATDTPLVSDLFFSINGDAAQLFAALAEAQPKFQPIQRTSEANVTPKDASKKGYKFKYAPLENLVDATRVALAEQGLIIAQPYHAAKGGWKLRTILAHKSGAYMEAIDFIPASADTTEQVLGGKLTYRRRYGYGAILGLASEDDDDGNVATGNAAQITQQTHRRPSGPPQRDDKTPATIANGTSLPAGWPDKSELPTIMRWIDALPQNLAAWKWGFATLQGNELLYTSEADWPLVMNHYADRITKLVAAKKFDVENEFILTVVPGEIARAGVMANSEAAQQQGTESDGSQTSHD